MKEIISSKGIFSPSEQKIFNKLQTKASAVGNNYTFPYEREIL